MRYSVCISVHKAVSKTYVLGSIDFQCFFFVVVAKVLGCLFGDKFHDIAVESLALQKGINQGLSLLVLHFGSLLMEVEDFSRRKSIVKVLNGSIVGIVRHSVVGIPVNKDKMNLRPWVQRRLPSNHRREGPRKQ